ncbi:shikimate 5-dehydrogenase [Patulibacter brassicae]|jgi:shikimate dehydrogenase|uniref:Shikimate 5-dehydrogenase n=1 Tax=Patulibacter brassicae TaxID=1705717 RepID=A0ABU4VMS9_9ACTN|nr:shikimate 5-dehydrogenase [Patulibacter brassicae]MDX8153144.1 shikimate 5-dehydrogenase [Patulibacter brassicae]
MTARELTKDTTLCISLSGRPSNVGTRFHNHLYGELGLDFAYKAFTTDDLPAAIAGIRGLGIRGCGVSMPFKEAVIPLVDELEASAAAIGAVNTIVNDGGRLVASNTDYLALVELLREVDRDQPAVVLGSGGMAKAAVAALRDGGFADVTVVARNPTSGPALAERYGARWAAALGDHRPGLLLNATPVGMAGAREADDLPVPEAALATVRVVLDVVAVPPETPLVRAARAAGATTITGDRVIALQAAEQFARYTGVRPSDEQVARASAISRPT